FRPIADIERECDRRLMSRSAIVLVVLGLVMMPVTALACSPVPRTPEQQGAVEDRQLREATVLYRGTIENLREEEGSRVMDVRRERVFWGSGARQLVQLPWDYFSQCPRGNLRVAELFGVSLRNGLGVTVIGRLEDMTRPEDLIILVDGLPDTERVLSRFRELRGTP
ncbi:MAG: hypothetical protein ACK5RN_12645, partial [bacterium]